MDEAIDEQFNLDFVGIGAAKAGTTWLARCLAEHPEVCMARPKEVNFFCRTHIWPSTHSNYHKGIDWLASRFHDCTAIQTYGEYSVSYLIDPESANLIYRHCPDAKIIVSYRHPTEALYSFYYQTAKEYPVPDTFEAFLEEYPRFIRYGDYYTHTCRFLEYFPLERIHFIIYTDINERPREVLQELFQFLEIRREFQPSFLSKRINQRKVPRSVLVRNVVGGAVEFFRTNSLGIKLKPFLNHLGVHKIADWIRERNLTITTVPAMSRQTRTRLIERYRSENEKLAHLLGLDLTHWNE